MRTITERLLDRAEGDTDAPLRFFREPGDQEANMHVDARHNAMQAAAKLTDKQRAIRRHHSKVIGAPCVSD